MIPYPNPKTLLALTKKNFWQYKNYFVGLPVGWMCFLGIFLILSLLDIVYFHLNDSALENNDINKIYIVTTLIPISIALVSVIASCLFSSLYEERKEKSILFYKSMPASDGEEVLSKFIMICLIGPIISIIIALIGFGLLSLLLIQPGKIDVSFLEIGVISINSILLFLTYFLWALPILAWAIFISAISPKSPFVFFSLPIVFIMVAEGFVFDSYEFADLLMDYAGNGVYTISFNLYGPSYLLDIFSLTKGEKSGFEILLNIFIASLQSPKLWLGFVLTTVFLAAAVFARRRAY